MTTDTNATFDQRRVWLDELLAKPHLWPSQVATLKVLAAELDIEVRIYDKDLIDGQWRQRD